MPRDMNFHIFASYSTKLVALDLFRIIIWLYIFCTFQHVFTKSPTIALWYAKLFQPYQVELFIYEQTFMNENILRIYEGITIQIQVQVLVVPKKYVRIAILSKLKNFCSATLTALSLIEVNGFFDHLTVELFHISLLNIVFNQYLL